MKGVCRYLHPIAVALALLCLSDLAGGQQIERQFTPPPEPKSTQDIEVPQVAAFEQAPDDAAQLRFQLTSLQLANAAAIDAEELLRPYRNLIGTEVSVADVFRIANELSAEYRRRGFILSLVTVPPQRIANGAVTLQVTEGFVDDVRFEGDAVIRPSMFAAIRQKLLAKRPLRAADLERYMLLINDLPGVTARATLSKSDSTAGAATLVLRLEHDRAAFSAGADNRGSELLGPLQGDASVTVNSLLGSFDSTSLRVISTGGNKELQYASLAHTQRLTANGLSLTISASRSAADPPLRPIRSELNIETGSEQYRLEVSHPWRRTRSSNVSLRGALTYHDGRTEFPAFGIALSRDTIAAVRVGVTYDFVDRFRGVNVVDLEVGQGFDGFGASEFGALDASRLGGRPDFTKVSLYGARLQSIGPGWSALVALSGQFALTNLLSPEEFSFGGEYFGRAYDSSELVGDSGVAAKLELRYTHDFGSGWATTVYGFGEAGRVWRRLLLDDSTGKEDGATSLGFGLRFDATQWFSGYVEWAAPQDQIVAAEGTDEARVFGGFRFKF